MGEKPTSNLHTHVSAEHNVLTLEISVDDSKGVAVSNGTSHLFEYMAGLWFREVPSCIDVVQEISILC